MYDIDAITRTAIAVGTPLAAVVRVTGRKRRLRNDIRENLALVEEVEKHDPLREHSLVSGWLQGRISLDIAKLTGQELGATKKPIEWGSVLVAALLTVGLAAWTYFIVRDGFIWYSVFPGVGAALCGVSILGMTTDREIPPEEREPIPPGAVRARTETASERVATAVAIAALGSSDDRLRPGGQADVALRFLKLMRLGAYEAGLELADDNWLRCRVHSWLWNNQAEFGESVDELSTLADAMLAGRGDNEAWKAFVLTEQAQFMNEWGSHDVDRIGIASRRRRIAQDMDLVILSPVGASGGYFVTEATALPNAFTFLMRRSGPNWLVANHLGMATPAPGWPPTWWVTGDRDIEALPEP